MTFLINSRIDQRFLSLCLSFLGKPVPDFKVLTTIFVITTAVTGCNSLPSVLPGSGQINVISDPPGAKVLASGKHIGQTPLSIVPDEAFPPHWKGSRYLVEGQLGLIKDGCKSYEMEVSDPVLSKDINVILDCDASYQKPAVLPEQSDAKPFYGVEARLDKLDTLKAKGKISDTEYNRIRQRILSDM